MKKVVIFGANGMLGHTVKQYLQAQGCNVLALTRNEYNIASEPVSKIKNLIQGYDIVINCAGIIKPLIQNYDLETLTRVNTEFPKKLAEICIEMNIKCIHITTDCVYSGRKGNYIETDKADADELYGLTKAAGENNLCMNLRTSFIGEESRANPRCLLEWVRSQNGKTVDGYTNHIWNGVTTLYLAEIINYILDNNLYKQGIFHIFSDQKVTKAELIQMISDIYKLDIKVNKVNTEKSCDRSLNSSFNFLQNKINKKLNQQIEEHKNYKN